MAGWGSRGQRGRREDGTNLYERGLTGGRSGTGVPELPPILGPSNSVALARL